MSVQTASTDSLQQQSPDDSRCERSVSEHKVQANRRNALRSTGPRTKRGKRTVACNAIKHGLLAREVVITAGDGRERLQDFDDLAERLCDHYKPVGVVEESLVQTIAACWWRKARVIRAENGEIRKRVDTLVVDSGLRRADKANLDLAITDIELPFFVPDSGADDKISSMDRWRVWQAVQQSIRGHRSGLDYLTAVLNMAKVELTMNGHISENTSDQILGTFVFLDYGFARVCRNVTRLDGASATAVRRESPKPVEGEDAMKVTALIDRYLERIDALREYASLREKLQTDAEARSFSLPDVEATGKLIRYEAHLDRQLYRAMDQLERLQRQRVGENVPPPLNINLGGRG